MEKNCSSGLLNSTTELRKLIVEHPELPLLVFAGEECNSGDFPYTSCSIVKVEIGEVLDCSQTINDCKVYIDRNDFRENIEDLCFDFDGSEREFEQFIEDIVIHFNPYWKPCIILYVNN